MANACEGPLINRQRESPTNKYFYGSRCRVKHYLIYENVSVIHGLGKWAGRPQERTGADILPAHAADRPLAGVPIPALLQGNKQCLGRIEAGASDFQCQTHTAGTRKERAVGRPWALAGKKSIRYAVDTIKAADTSYEHEMDEAICVVRARRTSVSCLVYQGIFLY